MVCKGTSAFHVRPLIMNFKFCVPPHRNDDDDDDDDDDDIEKEEAEAVPTLGRRQVGGRRAAGGGGPSMDGQSNIPRVLLHKSLLGSQGGGEPI